MPSRTAELLRTETPLHLAHLRRPGALATMPAVVDDVAVKFDGLIATLAAFDSAVETSESDSRLSPLGHRDAAQKVARAALAKLDAFEETTVKRLEDRAQSVRTAIEAAPPRSSDVGDRLVRELRHREIRDQFLGLDQLERTTAYLGISNPEIRVAMEEGPLQLEPRRPGAAPTLAAFIDPEQVSAQISARAEARDPERAAELRDFERLIRTYRTVLASARNAVLEVVPSIQPQPTIV